ncbi:MAG: hypothetical protein CMB51_02080 [Euryarchaeota archaeon]|nr:hypothetical protein [Euryarchaeota archaeon]|tara:strand:+ start:6042 stop:6254 length:213 start_codon:yes stop_codon:yes gene_type:complete
MKAFLDSSQQRHPWRASVYEKEDDRPERTWKCMKKEIAHVVEGKPNHHPWTHIFLVQDVTTNGKILMHQV